MSSNSQRYNEEARRTLLALALRSIKHGLEHGSALTVNPDDYPAPLTEPRATFVTLEKCGGLRGCIGTLEAHRPLVVDVAHNAYAAAFRDPRFPPLEPSELNDLSLHISVLTPASELHFNSEQALLDLLQPGIDGLILETGRKRGTFLPSVWDSLPKPVDFLNQLKRKAGLPLDYWSDEIKVFRYSSEMIE